MAASFLKSWWAYWLCQIVGWGGVAALGWIMDELQRLSAPSLSKSQDHFFLPLTCVAGFAVTDILRRIIKRGRWLELEPPKIIFRYAATLVIAAVFLSFCGTFIFASPPATESRLETFTVSLMANSSLVGAWMAIYFLIHFYEAFHHAREERALLKEAYMASQLEALRLQLNPHFLFNALNTIRALIPPSAAEAREGVTRLAGVLHSTLASKPSKTVPIAKEMEVVRDYLAIEKLRFGEHLRVVEELDPTLDQASIPPLMLLTLVENAIKHGVQHREEAATVVIRGDLEAGRVVLSVESPASDGAKHEDSSLGIGLKNVRERLQLICGDEATAVLESAEGSSIRSVLRYPHSPLREP